MNVKRRIIKRLLYKVICLCDAIRRIIIQCRLVKGIWIITIGFNSIK